MTPPRSAGGAKSRPATTARERPGSPVVPDAIQREAYILSQVKDGVICTDIQGIVTYWNQGAEEIFGWKAEEMLGRPVFERLPQEARAWGQERFSVVMKGSDSVGIRHDYRKDGSRVWLEVRSSRMNDAHGQPVGFDTFFRDISERVRAEEAIRQNQQMMAAAEQLANFGSWELELTNPDLNANKLRWSDEVFRIFGLAPRSIEATNDIFFQLIPQEEHAAIIEAVARAIATCGIYSIEHRVMRPNGEVRYVHERAQVFADEQGRPLKMVGTVHDMTERRRQELELMRSEDQFRSAMLHSCIGMALVGLEGKWLKVNPALCAIVGYSEAELLATDFQSITHPDDLADDLAHVRRLLAGEITNYQIEKRYIHKEGHSLWILLSVSLVRDHANRPLYFISQIQDITERKHALEEIVKAKDAAEAAARAKSEFLAVISHEIRTPLNPVLGAAQLLLDQKCAPEQRELLEVIHNAGEHLLTLLNDILDLAKMEAGSTELALAPARLGDVVKSVMEIKANDARTKRLELKSIFDESLAEAYLLDEPRVRQVILNLVGNAIKFTKHGGVTVCVERLQAGHERDLIRFSIKDTGIGIPPAHAARIFEPFYQVDSSSSRNYEGAGLGLAICRRLVDIMCGEIGVESTPEVGSNFWFAIWLERHRSPPGSGAPWPVPLVQARQRRVLLVEQQERNRVMLVTMLERAGCEVTVAETASSALALFHPGRFDLVLLGLQLPDLESTETSLLLHQREKTANRPSTLIIGHGPAEEVQRLRTHPPAGMGGFLTHPVRQAELMKVLNRVVPAEPAANSGEPELPPEGLSCIG